MNLKTSHRMKEIPQTRIHTLCVRLFKVQELAKLLYDNRHQNNAADGRWGLAGWKHKGTF